MLHVHWVFGTKYRRGVLNTAMPRACEDAVRKVGGDSGTELREVNGHDDHGHPAVRYPPKVAVPAPVNSLNRVSAQRTRPQCTGRVNRHPRHRHFRSPSCPDTSRGGAPPTTIQPHIEQQTAQVNPTSGLTPP